MTLAKLVRNWNGWDVYVAPAGSPTDIRFTRVASGLSRSAAISWVIDNGLTISH